MARDSSIPPVRRRLLSELKTVERRLAKGEVSKAYAQMEASRILQYLERLTFLDVRAEIDAVTARRRRKARTVIGLAIVIALGILYSFLR